MFGQSRTRTNDPREFTGLLAASERPPHNYGVVQRMTLSSSSDDETDDEASTASSSCCTVSKAKAAGLGVASFAVSLPNTLLVFLGELNIDLGSVDSLSALEAILKSKSPEEIALATSAAGLSLGVNSAVNYVFLPSSLKTTGGLFKDIGILVTNRVARCVRCCPVDADGNVFDESHITKRDMFIKGGSFIYALFPAFTYAAIGYEESSFLKPLAVAVFGLNGLTAFATRFNGIYSISKLVFDPDERFLFRKRRLLNAVSGGEHFVIPVDAEDPDGLTRAVAEYLQHVEEDIARAVPETFEYTWVGWAKSWVWSGGGLLGAVVTSVPLWPIVAYETLKGFDIFTNFFSSNSFFSEDNYQGAGQLVFGFIASLPNPFFYAKAMMVLPKEFWNTIVKLRDILKDNKKLLATAIFGLVGFAALCVYATGDGMADVAESAIDKGYLDYLGDLVNKTLIALAVQCGAGLINFLSCLMIFNKSQKGVLPDSIARIAKQDVIDLLNNPDGRINVTLLRRFLAGEELDDIDADLRDDKELMTINSASSRPYRRFGNV